MRFHSVGHFRSTCTWAAQRLATNALVVRTMVTVCARPPPSAGAKLRLTHFEFKSLPAMIPHDVSSGNLVPHNPKRALHFFLQVGGKHRTVTMTLHSARHTQRIRDRCAREPYRLFPSLSNYVTVKVTASYQSED